MLGPKLKRREKGLNGFNIDMHTKKYQIFIFTSHISNWTMTVVNFGWNICSQTAQGRLVFTAIKFFESDKAKVSTRRRNCRVLSRRPVCHYLFAGRVKVKRPCPLGPSLAIRMLNKAPNHPVYLPTSLPLFLKGPFLFYLHIDLVR